MDVSEGRNHECPACVHNQYEFLDRSSEHQINYASLCGRNTIQINPRQKAKQDLEKLAGRLKKNGKVKGNPFLLSFMPDDEITMVIFQDGRVLVHGTNDTVKAKSYYARYLGS